MRQSSIRPCRRSALGGIVAVTLAPAASVCPAAAATPDDQLAVAIRDITKGSPVAKRGVKIAMPELAENGNSVALTVAVESPSTPAEHVRTIHILSEKNPVATIARFRLGPRAGRAEVRTNVRLATSQIVVALAEMSDGSFRSDETEVVVTITACLDAG